MDHHSAAPTPSRAEAERLLGIAEKLLQTRDLTGSREFALLAQETEPLLEGSDQILAITDVLLASEKRVGHNRNQNDWYAILQTEPHSLSSDPDLLKKNYRRLALLLHPDKNKFPLSDSAFKLVADAWSLLSDPLKRAPYHRELNLNVFEKVDLSSQPPPPPPQQQAPPATQQSDKLPVRRSFREKQQQTQGMQNRKGGGKATTATSFWTACPYCYVLYEYARAYEECVMRCQNCQKAFNASRIPKLPPVVPGKEAYYCCWGFFPIGFSMSKEKEKGNDNVNVNNGGNDNNVAGFPNWAPGMFGNNHNVGDGSGSGGGVTTVARPPGFVNNVPTRYGTTAGGGSGGISGGKKRGRPRKNPLM